MARTFCLGFVTVGLITLFCSVSSLRSELSGAADPTADPDRVQAKPTSSLVIPQAAQQKLDAAANEWDEQRVPAGLYKPLPYPRRPAGLGDQLPAPTGRVVVHNIRTGVTSYRPATEPDPLAAAMGLAPGNRGGAVWRGEDPQVGQKDFTDYTLVTDPSHPDYRMNVKLWMTFLDGSGNPHYSVASGTLISPTTVLTAGHCVYSRDHGWAESITVVPAYYQGSKPFGQADMYEMMSWEGWIVDEDWDHDIGLIRIAKPLGALTGWRGYGWVDDCDFFTSGYWEHNDYPAEDSFDGEAMYHEDGRYDGCETFGNEVWYDNSGYGGSSGGGNVKVPGGYIQPHVFTVRSNTSFSLDTGFDSWDTKIVSGKFADIQEFVQQDIPGSVDFVALDVQLISPVAILGDYFPAPADFLLFNHSSLLYGGPLDFILYLSEDNVLDLFTDTILGEYTAEVLVPATGSVRVDFSEAVLPANLPVGDYYLGVYVTTDDFNLGNNGTNGENMYRFIATCVPQGTPVMTAPAPGAACLDTFVTLKWDPVLGAASYDVHLAEYCTLVATYQTTAESLLVTGLETDAIYRWNVRAVNGCEIGAWSPSCRFFTTKSLRLAVPTLNYPDDGAICRDIYTDVWWGLVNGADYYILEVGTECGNGDIYRVYGTNKQMANLLHGATYYWRVIAWSDCDESSGWSDCRSFTTEGGSPVIGGLRSPSFNEGCLPLTPLLDWMDAPGAASYAVELHRDGSPFWISSAAESHYVTPTLEPNTTYEWRVRGYDPCGYSGDWTPLWPFHTGGGPPAAPVLTEPGGGQPCAPATTTFVWNKMSGTQEYQLRVGIACGTGSTYDTTSEFYTLNDLPDGTTLFWQVRAMNTCGQYGAWSACQSFDVDATSPANPIDVRSLSHPVGIWRNDPRVVTSWSGESDTGCGVAGVSLLWDNLAGSMPDSTVEASVPPDTSRALPDGQDNWFHLRTIDVAGNASVLAEHLGPFWIDATLPVITVLQPNGGELWSAGSVQTIAWDAADRTSGLNRVYLYYSKDGGLNYVSIGNVFPPEATFNWTVPIDLAGDILIKATARDNANNVTDDLSDGIITVQDLTGVGEGPASVTNLVLKDNHPNPFNPSTTVRFSVPRPEHVRLTIYDAQGRQVRLLVDTELDGPQWHEMIWDGRDGAGQSVSSGVFIVRLSAGGQSQSHRMVLLK